MEPMLVETWTRHAATILDKLAVRNRREAAFAVLTRNAPWY
jgi:hypothetical protein